jgi:hypothetical protein
MHGLITIPKPTVLNNPHGLKAPPQHVPLSIPTILLNTGKKKHRGSVNSPLVAPKRKRKVTLAACPQCGSPHLLAFSDIKHKTHDANAIVTIVMRCTSCKYIENTLTRTNTAMFNKDFEDAISKYYHEILSPNEVELTFRFFKFEKTPWATKEDKDCPDIHAFCTDAAGVYYRFAGESAKKILYFGVKDRNFKAVIAFQKHWKKMNTSPTHSPGYSVPGGTILNFRQSPKIIGGIALI